MNRLLASLLILVSAGAQAQGTVYRCPGPPVLYTDALSAKEAQEKGCRSIEGTPITVMQTAKPRAPSASPTPGNEVARGAESRVEVGQQRVRDDERRRVLQTELRQAEERLTMAQKEFGNGQGERRGDERNYQKYLDRMAELKDNIARYEADVQALKREIAKLP
jgi:predicted lipid-binding transport protein (Tim44 family)